MKTIKTIFAVIVTLFATNIAVASGSLKVNFVSNDADLTVVEISNAKTSHFEIGVTDLYGEKLYHMETDVPRSEFKKRYDFSQLDNGEYLYTVKIDKEKITKRFAVENGSVEVMDIKKSLEPAFIEHENMLKMSFLNFQKDDVKIYVYDSLNQLLAESSLGNDFAIHKAINKEEFRYGSYNVVITDGSEIYEHQFTVN